MKPIADLSASGRRARRRALGSANDLTGRRFGALVIDGPTGQKNRLQEVLWQCKCDCGMNVLSTAYSLYRGLRKNCGCGRGAPAKVAKKDCGELTAVRWGKMVQAAERAGKPITISQEEAWNFYRYQGAACALTGLPLAFSDARLQLTTPYPRWVHRDLAKLLIFVPETRLLEISRQLISFTE
jgi:hypothetical protein